MWALPAGGGTVKAVKRAAVEQRGARRVTPAALPTPVLVIQEIQTSWTKASRGAPGSVARQTVPQAVLLSDPIRPSPEPTYAHHVVRYDEANQFVAPLTSHLRIQAGDQREPIHEGASPSCASGRRCAWTWHGRLSREHRCGILRVASSRSCLRNGGVCPTMRASAATMAGGMASGCSISGCYLCPHVMFSRRGSPPSSTPTWPSCGRRVRGDVARTDVSSRVANKKHELCAHRCGARMHAMR